MRYMIFLVSILAISFVLAGNYSIEFNQIGEKIVVRESLDGVLTSSILDNELEETQNGFLFLKKIQLNSFDEIIFVRFNLDESYLIGEEGIYPDGFKFIGDGRHLGVQWENITESSLLIMVDIEKPSENRFYFFYIILFLLFGFLISKFYKKKDKIDKYLLDVERKVLEILRKADRHELWQKEIQKRLELSKAKTSRVIRNLESRNLIEKIPFGNTNKIKLK